MSIPTQHRQWAERLTAAIETAAGSGSFVDDGRLVVERAEALCDGRIATARLNVSLADFSDVADAMRMWHGDRRIVIRAKDVVVFDGYPGARHYERRQQDGSRSRPVRRLVIDLVHRDVRAERDEAAQVYGRFVRDAAILARLAAGDTTAERESVRVTALSTAFNAGGRPNCAAVPIVARTSEGGSRLLHVFTDDLDETAIPWTFARATRYLLHFHGADIHGPSIEPILRQTDKLAVSNDASANVVAPMDSLSQRLLGVVSAIDVDGTTLIEAMRRMCRAAGLRFHSESRWNHGEVETAWRLWPSEGEAIRCVQADDRPRTGMGRPVAAAGDARLREWFAARGATKLGARVDESTARSVAIVIGGIRRHAIRAELMPGWLPEIDLDNVPMGSRGTAKGLAMSDADILAMGPSAADESWFRRYHRLGVEFSANHDVGRLWILNESGEYSTELFGRAGPFATYAAYDMSPACACVMRRRRPLIGLPDEADLPGGVRVEVSYDDGAHWYLVSTGYELVTDRAGVWFCVDNPLSIRSVFDANANLWTALVDQTMRVRVTGLIESDDRVSARVASSGARTAHRDAILLRDGSRFQQLIPFPNTIIDEVDERDDTAAIRDCAEALAQENAARGVTATFESPWIDESVRLGMRIDVVTGTALPLHALRTPTNRYATIVGIRYFNTAAHFGTEIVAESAPAGTM